mgnify:FL=1
MKSEKGSVTMLVLVVLLIITAFIIGLYILNKNRISETQINQARIEKNYDETQEIDQIYEEVLSNEEINGGENEDQI